MGNCLWGGMSDPETVIKVTTSNGGIMEFYAPVTVSSITDEFPDHGIFPRNDLFCKPLCQFDELVAGQSYHLLPLINFSDHPSASGNASSVGGCGGGAIVHARSHSVPSPRICYPAPYRMSLDYQHYQGVGLLKRNSTEALSCRVTNTSNNSGKKRRTGRSKSKFWKVKLVITPEQLLEILSQESRTKELVESVRIVAKCGVSAVGFSAVTSIVSDQWSLSSSGRSAPSKIDALV
ncbi:uncharacterized protein LOC130735420 [Lotus japonicus]|uniref:uncharacterized protein LOC130735420 n=1 Tax=Lotus japonicus TaxID=34305 RepID=UPI00259079DE|nr:uncharacterized protein LOC130735420 [Lotus japonicus]